MRKCSTKRPTHSQRVRHDCAIFQNWPVSWRGTRELPLRLRDHSGELRAEQPEVLEGSPRLTIDLINGITRQHKYASGCLAFRTGEQPSKSELHTIIDKFKAVVAPGLAPDQFNSLFVLHREPPAPQDWAVRFSCSLRHAHDHSGGHHSQW